MCFRSKAEAMVIYTKKSVNCFFNMFMVFEA